MVQPPRRGGPPGRPTFNFIEPDFDDVQKRLSGNRSGFPSTVASGVNMFNGRPGENTVRILPSNWNSKHWAFDLYEHRFVGSPQGTYLCLQNMKRQRCPICEEALNIRRSGDVEAAKKVEAKYRWYCYVLDRSGSNPNQPLIWDMDYVKHNEIMTQTQEIRSKQIVPVSRPDHGYDLTFLKTGAGMGTRYVGFKFDRTPSPIADNQTTFDNIIAFINDHRIPDILKYCTTEELDRIMSGTLAEQDAELEGDEEGTQVEAEEEVEVEVEEIEAAAEEVEEEQVEEEEVVEEEEIVEEEEAAEEAPEPEVRSARRPPPPQAVQPAPRQRLASNGGNTAQRTVVPIKRPVTKPATKPSPRRYQE